MISVIIPVLNEAATIGATLEHLLHRSERPEIIVVDGGSTDETVASAERYAKVLPAPQGRAVQMNHGASLAKGDILLFLHADTRLPAGALSALEEAMTDPRVVGGRFKVRLDSPRPIFRVIESSINLRDRLFRGFTGDQAIFVRASVFRQLGGYRPLPLMEDLDLGTRLCRCGHVVLLPLAVTTSARRWERRGVISTVVLMWLLRASYLLGVSPHTISRFYPPTR